MDPKFFPGYKFKSGGSTQLKLERKGIVKQTGSQLDEVAYSSSNVQKISRARIDNGGNPVYLELDKDKPFIMIVPDKHWPVSFYDEKGGKILGFEETH